VIALFLVIALGVWGIFARYPQPEIASKIIMTLAFLGPVLLFAVGVEVSPAAWGPSPVVISLLVLIAAALPPLVGLVEGRASRHGACVYERSRFASHLLANLAGAVAVIALVVAVQRVVSGAGSAARDGEALTIDVTVPLAVLIVLAFAVAEQDRVRRDRAEQNSGREGDITGYSLSHGHAMLNSAWLAITVFAGTSSVILLLDAQIATWRAGDPRPIPWVALLAVLAGMAFVLNCGLEGTHDSATYVTFATGAPGLLAMAVAFAARSNASGATFLLLVLTIVIGSVLSVALAVRMEKAYRWWVHVVTSVTLMAVAALTAVRGLEPWAAAALLSIAFLVYVVYVVGIIRRLRGGLRSTPTHYWTAFLILSVIMLTVSSPALERAICPHLGDVCPRLAASSASQ